MCKGEESMKSQWLEHLTDSIPIEAQRNRISLYTIALEGWRRGMTLSFHMSKDTSFGERLIYTLQYKDQVHYFSESSGDKNSKKAHTICHNKDYTYKYLENNNVPVPKSKLFEFHHEEDQIIEAVKELRYPLVIKPTDGSSGKGVIVNIKDEQMLKEALKHVRETLNYKSIIVQEHVEGNELRFYVLNNQVLAVTNRRPANIVGDGHSTIFELIESTNEKRKYNPHIKHRPIRIDREVRGIVEKSGYTLDSVLEKGKRLYLRKISNISTGGESINVTDQVTKEQKDIAIKAAQSIPGLAHCGIDMIITGNLGVVLEVNTRPGIGMHMFPSEGKAVDIAKEIIDFYFPETKNLINTSSNVYFDLQSVFDTIYNGYATSIKLKQHPKGKLVAKRLNIVSRLDINSFYEIIKRPTMTQGLYGHIKRLNDHSIELLVSHEDRSELESFKQFLLKRKKTLQIEDIEEAEWLKPIRMSFKLIDGYQQMDLPALEGEYKQLHRQLRTIEAETKRLARRIQLTKKSTSWKITAPLRKVMDLIRR